VPMMMMMMMMMMMILLGDPPASEFYVPMFRNTLAVPSS